MINPYNYLPVQYQEIINPYMIWIKLAFYLILFLSIFYMGWAVNGWRLNNKIAAIELAQIEAIQKAQEEQQKIVAKADEQYVKEINDAKKTINGLRYCISHGTCRVSIPSSRVSTSNGSSVNHAASRCELSQASANDLISIAEDGDNAIIQLTACQRILKGLQ